MRSGTSPEAMACASFGTISGDGIRVILICRSGFFSFHAAIRSSTMALIAAAPFPHLQVFGHGRQRNSNQQPRQGSPAGL